MRRLATFLMAVGMAFAVPVLLLSAIVNDCQDAEAKPRFTPAAPCVYYYAARWARGEYPAPAAYWLLLDIGNKCDEEGGWRDA